MGMSVSDMTDKELERAIKCTAYFRMRHLMDRSRANAYQAVYDSSLTDTIASARAFGIERSVIYKLVGSKSIDKFFNTTV
jgi:hypothetical protein